MFMGNLMQYDVQLLFGGQKYYFKGREVKEVPDGMRGRFTGILKELFPNKTNKPVVPKKENDSLPPKQNDTIKQPTITRCQAKTAKGIQCKRDALPGKPYCTIHGKKYKE